MSELRILKAGSAGSRRLRARIAARLDSVLDAKVGRAVRRIVDGVRRGGESALIRYSHEIDQVEAASLEELRLRPEPGDSEGANIPPALRAAIELAIGNVEKFHRAQQAEGFRFAGDGFVVEEIVRPLARAGIYVPGGRASYPSTAIMTVVPARIAGVASLAVATPARSYREQPALRYTLARLGVDEIWGVGGAAAIAALAHGCGAIARVDVVAGPGNAWVTAAKRMVAGAVAIDGLMGPSEVVIVAGADASPRLVAADLLAQAEHDPRASAILITTSRRLARSVAAEIDRQLSGLATAETARAALAKYGGALLVGGIDEAVALAAELAPEHLQLVGREIEAAAERFEVAGAIFVGERTPEVFGDYLAGPSHVLPTCGTARFSSGLSVATFERRMHRVQVTDPRCAVRWAAAAAALARSEGLPAHAFSASVRQEETS